MGACLSGDFPGGLVCSGASAAPVTLAELVLGASDGLDYYDMSLTGGFNVPVALVPAPGACPTAACATNLTSACPRVARGAWLMPERVRGRGRPCRQPGVLHGPLRDARKVPALGRPVLPFLQ
jgi:hypothetical protein